MSLKERKAYPLAVLKELTDQLVQIKEGFRCLLMKEVTYVVIMCVIFLCDDDMILY